MTHLYLDSVEQHSYGHQKGVPGLLKALFTIFTANITPIYCKHHTNILQSVGACWLWPHLGWVYLASYHKSA